jgi:hypothetical protein
MAVCIRHWAKKRVSQTVNERQVGTNPELVLSVKLKLLLPDDGAKVL